MRTTEHEREVPERTLDEVLAVGRFLADFPGRWWVGGGWAIDLWIGSPSRPHEDIEICVLRRDQERVFDYCRGWQFLTARENRFVPLAEGERLVWPEYMLVLKRAPETVVPIPGMPPTFEFILNDAEADDWVFDSDLMLSFERVAVPSPLGLPVTAPEILLLLKAHQRDVRAKDDHDFHRVRDLLSDDQRGWLTQHLEQRRSNHRWLPQLR